MATRRRAREVALQLLYEADLNPGREEADAQAFILRRLHGRKALAQFAQGLLLGTLLHREQIDRQLSRCATNWSLGRMAATDRNILRLGAYEMTVAGTPGRVAIMKRWSLRGGMEIKTAPVLSTEFSTNCSMACRQAPPKAGPEAERPSKKLSDLLDATQSGADTLFGEQTPFRRVSSFRCVPES